ncbi:MAG: NAD(P)-dependent alcohol dehydrogenase [Deltaproteobacteria bacterium]|nr:NAD(P)-dependent alcohol dehydrogenase [Deltaproteobacteria bacterium]
MSAIVQDRYGSADVLQLRAIERPRPRPDEVIVRVHAAGVDFGVWHLMEGMPYAVRLATGLRRPRNPVRGLELAGVVAEVGAKVTGFAPGDAVFGTGAGSFAEYARATQSTLVPMPSNLGFEAAAVVPVSATTALVGLRAANLQAGQTVLITGAGGGVGSYAVQLARAMGAEVTAVCSTSKLDFVRALGAAHAIDYTRDDFTTGDRTYDAIIDLAGSRGVSTLRRALAPTGTLVLVGGEGGGKWLGMGRQVWSKIVGVATRQKFRSPLALVNQADLRILKDMLEAGTLTPVVERRYPLHEVPTAIRALAAGHSRGKAVITVS